MTAFPPLDVRLEAAKFSCVIDSRLALSRWGLMFSWRLSDDMDVWLYRGLWALLDSAQLYLEEPEALMGGAARNIGPPLDLEAACESLGQWEPARLEDTVPSFPFYYVGDLRYESHLPKRTDADLIRRFDLLAKALDTRACRSLGADAGVQPQVECWRDAAALNAALTHYRPLIFTLAEDPNQAPALCHFLAECGLECRKMSWAASANPMRQYLIPLLIRTGAAELVWAGLRLAAVNIIAPRAFTIPKPRDEESRPALDEGFLREGVTTTNGDLWEGAVCIWYSLS
jgi:hypothetical protein